MAGFSLIKDPWIPAVQGGELRWLRPGDIVLGPELPVDVSWGRPDLRVATYELLIGLLTVAMAPKGTQPWRRLYDAPPSPAELDAALAPLAPYFELDGDGLRFMQDLALLQGDVLPPDALLIDMQGEDGTFFTKPGRHAVLSRAAGAIALYALQAFAPSGGRGNRTSMRGGGPLTTLVMPGDSSLWQRLWANVPVLGEDDERAPDDLALVFPWAAATRTSETNLPTTPEEHAHPLQAYFGMPRRIRLRVAPNTQGAACAITGIIDEMVVTGFVQRPHGVKYEAWKHPLTPYYAPTAGAPATLPLHPKSTPIGYRQWIGLLYDGERGAVAQCVNDAKGRLAKVTVGVLAAGYVTDNMKVLDYAESDLPLHILGDEAAQKTLEAFARTLIAAADQVAVEMRKAVGAAIDSGYDATPAATATTAYWSRTEQTFRALLHAAAALKEDEAGDTARLQLRVGWRKTLEAESLEAFDAVVPLDTLGDLPTTRRAKIIGARKNLVWALLGYGKAGAKIFSMLGISAPTKAKQADPTTAEETIDG